MLYIIFIIITLITSQVRCMTGEAWNEMMHALASGPEYLGRLGGGAPCVAVRTHYHLNVNLHFFLKFSYRFQLVENTVLVLVSIQSVATY